MFFTSYKPTCFFKLLFLTLNYSQKSYDKPSCYKTFDFFKTSRIMFLALFPSTEHATSQIKTKNIDVLSVSVKFWYKKHFIILYFS